MMDDKLAFADWERISQLCGPNNEYLFCSVEKMDDPDGRWFEGFCSDAERNGFTVYVTQGPHAHIYVKRGTNWKWTGVCPSCRHRTVISSRCVQCGWES